MMIQYNKCLSYSAFMRIIKGEFSKQHLVESLRNQCKDSFDVKLRGFDSEFEKSCIDLITLANIKTAIPNAEMPVNLEKIIKTRQSTIYSFLSFGSEQEAHQQLYGVPYIENDWVFNLLEYTFFALILLSEKLERSFFKSYEVWRNTMPIGFAGYSEKVGYCSYYLTWFSNKVFLVDPVLGTVKVFEDVRQTKKQTIVGLSVGRKKKEDGDSCEMGVVHFEDGSCKTVVETTTFGSIVELQPAKDSGLDMKAAERRALREKGADVGETPWLTSFLGKYEGSNFYMRNHTLIALCVYGLEVMKYGVMEANSIFTIDHINGVHNDNSIDNLQLLTRKANNLKKSEPEGYYFDYFSYWRTQIDARKREQELFNFRSKSIF